MIFYVSSTGRPAICGAAVLVYQYAHFGRLDMFAVVLVFLLLVMLAGFGALSIAFINVAFGPRSSEPRPCARKCDLIKRASTIKVDPDDARSPTWGEIVNEYMESHQKSAV